MDTIRLKAMAKINLGLDVLRKREDGYHEVRMVMQTIKVYDQLTIQIIKEPEIRVHTNLYYLPENENNLVYKAAKLLLDEYSPGRGVDITLRKHIPVAAGLAGGSSDAAAVLVGLNRLFSLKLTMQELMDRGVKIGADVPYCIMRGTALAEGIGEVLTPLPAVPSCFVLVAKPGISVSTKFVYEHLKLDSSFCHPDIPALVTGIMEGSLNKMLPGMGNVLETVTIPAYPIIGEIKDIMKKYGALHAMMSGSGPTVFGLFETKERMERAYQGIWKKHLAKQMFMTTFFQQKAADTPEL